MRTSTVAAKQRYGRLITVESFLRKRKSGFNGRVWICQCDCGRKCEVPQSGLKGGQTKSCGCLQVEQTVSASLRHGEARYRTMTSEYAIWVQMRQRCDNPADLSYPRYGGRGIAVCDRWGVFEAFLSDMGRRPPKHSIDRINNDGDYEPSNCRWATQSEQARNTRSSKFITHDGETLCHTDWERRLGIRNGVIYSRLKRGWPIDQVLRART